MDPRISVIVATRNRSEMLDRLLRSFRAVAYPAWEVIVVDDGSTDTTSAVAEGYRRQGLPLSYKRQSWGRMGAARNLGLAHARGEIAAFTDDDCVVDPGWLSSIAATFDAHPEAFGVQGRTVTDRSAMTPFTRQVEQLEGGQPYRTCNIAFRTGVLRRLGGFDPELIRGEDVVLGMRVRELGSIVFAPDAVVRHPPRPKEWAGRTQWRALLASETHFKRRYPEYAAARSQTLSVQRAEHALSRWVLLPVRLYWRRHYEYCRRHPIDYARHVPSIIGEKLALLLVFPSFVFSWMADGAPGRGEPGYGEIALAIEQPDEEPLVSVVIPTRNRAHLLPGLLSALDDQTHSRREFVVVDDASSDATWQLLQTWQREEPASRVAIRQDPGSGSYAARNRGWQQSKGSVIAFTDDDCLPQPGWLSALSDSLRADSTAGTQGVTLPVPGEITPFTHQIDQTSPGPPYRTCNMAYLRQILEALGGFDETFHWYADNIFGLEARRTGAIAFAPDAVVFHPPRRRAWRGRNDWLTRFEADAEHRNRLRRLGVERRTVPGRVLPVVLWIVRPLIKQSLSHVRYAARHPLRYLRDFPALWREKVEMVRAISEYRFGERGGDPEVAARTNSHREALPADPLVSVVIVSRRAVLLEGALAALDRQTWTSREVIVVEHGDGSVLAVAEKHGARCLNVPGAAGLAEARQKGLGASTGAIIAFTDDDCVPHPDWLEAVVRRLQSQPQLAGVQGRTVAEAGEVGAHVTRVADADSLFQTCNIAYRRDALLESGGFDLRFRRWFEDTAVGARVQAASGLVKFAPEMLVMHRALPRRQFDRERWHEVLRDERLLARHYPHFYRRVRGPGFLTAVTARWLIGSPLKTLVRQLPSARRDPAGYLRLVLSLMRERRELIAAMRDISREYEKGAGPASARITDLPQVRSRRGGHR